MSMPPAFAARSIRRACVHADGQRLLHHHVDVARRGGLDDGRVVVRAGERRDRLRPGPVQHGREIGEEDRAVEAELGRVLLLERGVRFEDADDLHVLAGLRGFEETGHVAVDQAGNREFQRCRRRGLCRRGSLERQHRKKQGQK